MLSFITAVYMFIVLKIARPPVRLLRQEAAFSCCFYAILGPGFRQLQVLSDAKHQLFAVRRLDEMPARLGPNWRGAYLKSARAAYDMNP